MYCYCKLQAGESRLVVFLFMLLFEKWGLKNTVRYGKIKQIIGSENIFNAKKDYNYDCHDIGTDMLHVMYRKL